MGIRVNVLLAAVCAAVMMAGCGGGASSRANGAHHLHGDIEQALAGHDARVGVAAICGTDTIVVNDCDDYPLMSVFKLHIALALLERAEQGLISVDSVVAVPYGRLRPDTYSPLREIAAGRDTMLSVHELMRYSMGRSDNNACDILIDLCGGVAAVENAVRRLAADEVTVLTETEESMHADVLRSYNNHTSPLVLCSLMKSLYEGRLLDGERTECVKALLGGSTTGRDKIAAGIPAGSFLGHKSGLSDRTPDGVLMASADVAAFSMPDGRPVYLAVMVKDSREPDEEINKVFGEVARIVYEGL